MNEMLKKRQNKQMMYDQNHSPQKELSLECLWLLIRKLKTKMKQFPALQPQDFDREKVEREFINLASHYQQIRESFKKLVGEVPHMKKQQYKILVMEEITI